MDFALILWRSFLKGAFSAGSELGFIQDPFTSASLHYQLIHKPGSRSSNSSSLLNPYCSESSPIDDIVQDTRRLVYVSLVGQPVLLQNLDRSRLNSCFVIIHHDCDISCSIT